MSEESLPPDWIKCMSKKFKQAYFFNTQTNETSWVHPLLKNKGVPDEPTEKTKPSKGDINAKMKKKKSDEKASSSKEPNKNLKIPKQTKPPISKAKEKPDPKKLSSKELEKLGVAQRKRTEKIALWAENVNKSSNNPKNSSETQKTKPKKKAKDTSVTSNDEPKTETAKEPTSKTAKRLSEIINKKTVDTSKKIPKIPKKDKNKTKEAEKASEKNTTKELKPQTEDSENPFLLSSKIFYANYIESPNPFAPTTKSSSTAEPKYDNFVDSPNPFAPTAKPNSSKEHINYIESPHPFAPTTRTFNRESSNNIQQNETDEDMAEDENLADQQIHFNKSTQQQQNSNIFNTHQQQNPFKKEQPFTFQQQNNPFQQNVNNSSQHPQTSTFGQKNGFHQQDPQPTSHSGRLEEQSLANYAPIVQEGEASDMEIDDVVQFSKEIMKEIREMRSENVVSKPAVATENAPMEVKNLIYTDPLYIVLDTNILLAHLKFVSDLKDYPIPGIGTPILYIPWMVLQELDSLKDAVNRHHTQTDQSGAEKTYKLNILARKAIKFINTCLEADHPRVKGQTAIEASTPIDGFTEESNDDAIIHAALSLKLRACHSNIVMFSNDRNLCNKAMVGGIKAFSQQNLMMGIRSLYQNGTVAIRKENYQEYYEAYKVQEIIAKERKQADELSCELQCMLREGLSQVIEHEMKEAYGADMWLHIVKIQPPWTLQDVFTLLEKHWIAVFGHVIQRNRLKIVEELKKKFQDAEGIAGTLQVSHDLIEFSVRLFEAFSIRSSYNDMMTKCLAGCRVLLDKCNEYIQEKNGTVAHANPNQGKLPQTKENVSVEREEGEAIHTNTVKHGTVLDTFDDIWRTVTHYSALIFRSLDFPSQLVKELDPNEPKPDPKEANACLTVMTKCLLQLIRKIQDVVRIPVERLIESEEVLVQLLQAVSAFMKEVMKRECFVTPIELLHFSQDKNTRTALIQGLSQLDRSYAMLQQCIEYQRSI